MATFGYDTLPTASSLGQHVSQSTSIPRSHVSHFPVCGYHGDQRYYTGNHSGLLAFRFLVGQVDIAIQSRDTYTARALQLRTALGSMGILESVEERGEKGRGFT